MPAFHRHWPILPEGVTGHDPELLWRKGIVLVLMCSADEIYAGFYILIDHLLLFIMVEISKYRPSIRYTQLYGLLKFWLPWLLRSSWTICKYLPPWKYVFLSLLQIKYTKKKSKLLISLPCLAAVAFATPLLEARASNAILGIITYAPLECTSTEIVSSFQYFTTDGPCKNVPPIPSTPLVPFASFGTGFFPPAGYACELQIYADANCAGQHEGFSNPSIKCQNVGLELASQGILGTLPAPKVGAKSIRLTCVKTW